MKTKEELINEVYGDNLERVKDFIDMSSGVVSDRQYYNIDCPHPATLGFTPEDVVTFWTREYNGEKVVDVFNWLPESLKGLEDNNGWLPLKGKPHEIDHIGRCELYNIETKHHYITTDENEYIELGKFTHYKPFVSSEPPLY